MSPVVDVLPDGDPLGIVIGVIIGLLSLLGGAFFLWRQFHKVYERSEDYHVKAAEQRDKDIAELRAALASQREEYETIESTLRQQLDELRSEVDTMRAQRWEWRAERHAIETAHNQQVAAWATERAELKATIGRLEQDLERARTRE